MVLYDVKMKKPANSIKQMAQCILFTIQKWRNGIFNAFYVFYRHQKAQKKCDLFHEPYNWCILVKTLPEMSRWVKNTLNSTTYITRAGIALSRF